MDGVTRVKIASLLFGVGSWITIIGFWAELPLLVSSLPEKWKLPSQLTFFIQAANIGPLIFWICRRYKICSEVTATHIQMVIGVISCFVLVIAWDVTFHVFGEDRSILLLISAFGLSLVDCTSSVTFLPFMARLNSIHLTPYLIGEGLSGFIPIVLATIQGVGESEACSNVTDTTCSMDEECTENITEKIVEPLFSANIFFTSLLGTLLLSWFAFFWLLYSQTARAEYVTKDGSDENNEIPDKVRDCSDKKYFILQGIIIYACLSTFGIMPSIQSYSTLPYGGWSLHWTVILTGLAYPFGCFIAMFKHTSSMKVIYSWTIIGTAISIVIFIAALMSPTPPLSSKFEVALGVSSQLIGGSAMVIAWTSYVIIFSYVKTVITVIVSEEKGEEALFTVGLFTQIGSVFGAGFMFITVNYLDWFHEC